MAKAMVYFRDSQAPSWFSRPRTDVPAEPPLIGHEYSSENLKIHVSIVGSVT